MGKFTEEQLKSLIHGTGYQLLSNNQAIFWKECRPRPIPNAYGITDKLIQIRLDKKGKVRTIFFKGACLFLQSAVFSYIIIDKFSELGFFTF